LEMGLDIKNEKNPAEGGGRGKKDGEAFQVKGGRKGQYCEGETCRGVAKRGGWTMKDAECSKQTQREEREKHATLGSCLLRFQIKKREKRPVKWRNRGYN